MAETDAMQKALELDRDFELRLVRWNFERLASYIRPIRRGGTPSSRAGARPSSRRSGSDGP